MALDLPGLKALRKQYEQMNARANDKARHYKEAGEYMIAGPGMKDIFDARGPGWKPSRGRGGDSLNAHTLVDRNKLFKSITYKSDASGVQLFTPSVYGGTHQYGAPPVTFSVTTPKGYMAIPIGKYARMSNFKLSNYKRTKLIKGKNGKLYVVLTDSAGKIKYRKPTTSSKPQLAGGPKGDVIAVLVKAADLKIPARPFLVWPQKARDAIKERISNYIVTGKMIR